MKDAQIPCKANQLSLNNDCSVSWQDNAENMSLLKYYEHHRGQDTFQVFNTVGTLLWIWHRILNLFHSDSPVFCRRLTQNLNAGQEADQSSHFLVLTKWWRVNLKCFFEWLRLGDIHDGLLGFVCMHPKTRANQYDKSSGCQLFSLHRWHFCAPYW